MTGHSLSKRFYFLVNCAFSLFHSTKTTTAAISACSGKALELFMFYLVVFLLVVVSRLQKLQASFCASASLNRGRSWTSRLCAVEINTFRPILPCRLGRRSFSKDILCSSDYWELTCTAESTGMKLFASPVAVGTTAATSFSSFASQTTVVL